MVVTPVFSLSQDDSYVFLSIKIPYIRVSDAEIIVEGSDFSFYCKPYLLKLSFPGAFDPDEEKRKAVYDPNKDNGTINLSLPKFTIGEHFPDLDLTTQLLVKSKLGDGAKSFPSIEELGVQGSIEAVSLASPSDALLRIKYGFMLSYDRVLANLREASVDMLENPDPEKLSLRARRAMRIRREQELFDQDRYLADFEGCNEDEIYLQAMKFRPFWVEQYDCYQALRKKEKASQPNVVVNNIKLKEESFSIIGGFSLEETEILAQKLKNRQYAVTTGSKEEQSLLLGLVDLLFAFCYDCRITGNEPNVESASNIVRLSCQLSWLDHFDPSLVDSHDCLQSTILFCVRRSLIFPYLRVWKLARKVLADVAKLLALGNRAALKALLQMKCILDRTNTHYLLSKLFIDDYCTWIQSVGEPLLDSFAKLFNEEKTALEAGDAGKNLTGLKLVELEGLIDQTEEDDIDPLSLDIDITVLASNGRLGYLHIACGKDAVNLLETDNSFSLEQLKEQLLQMESSEISQESATRANLPENSNSDFLLREVSTKRLNDV